MTSAQAALASADAAAAKSKKGPIVAGPPAPSMARPPGVAMLQAGALSLQQQQHLQQQQQQQQQLAEAAKKRKRADSLLPPPPEDALSMEAVFGRARMGGGTAALAGLPGIPPSVSAAAGALGTDGPALSVDEILRRPEYQRAAAAAAAAAGKPGAGGAAGLKGGKGRDGRRDDEGRVLPESQLRRLMELQGLNKAFRMQPELQEQLTKLTEAFVSDAVDFGCALAVRRRGATLRPSDLALYMQRSHHIYVPGFNKEYRQYKRPVPSELHKARTILVRKAQLHPQQQQQAAAAAGEGGGKAGGVRFSGAE
ncbi:hypothetical protein OEZ85_012168 [Tetradesmus obliquus]|uniref:Transcription initiation factor TFIID subunit 12 domain-containing protein n=1 Tax=Tetradesmus obliquus TaxID=3088 RepID=A0ABY8TUU9_TETOB|nr:hypothetical protein OEZ85_012168 [Tetradesmus obliquus]